MACEIKSVGNHMESFSRNPDIAKKLDGDIILAADHRTKKQKKNPLIAPPFHLHVLTPEGSYFERESFYIDFKSEKFRKV